MIEIVPMCGTHIASIANIEKQCFKTPWSMDMIAEELKNPLARYFVMQNDNDTFAYIGYYKILDEAHITNVAVSPMYQSKGFAKKLVEYALAKMRGEGIVRATLEVNEHNGKAISLYEKYGFKLSGRRPNYYEGVDAALIYWLDL